MFLPHTHKRDTWKLLEVIDMVISLIVGIVSWVDAYVRTHQTAYIKHEQFFVHHLYLNKAVQEKKRKRKPSHPLMK